MIPQQQKLLTALDSLLSDGQQLLTPLGRNIWHGQTMLYDAEATKRASAFIVRFRAVADQLGGDALQWKQMFSSGFGHFDVNLMRQMLGVLEGFRGTVQDGLLDSHESADDMDHNTTTLERFDCLLMRGAQSTLQLSLALAN